MRFTRKATTLVAAVGAGALGVSIFAAGGGIGASFTSSATAQAKIAVGNFDCQLSSDYPGVTISASGHSAALAFSSIEGSAPGSQIALVTLKNTGDMPAVVNSTVETSGTLFASSVNTPISPLALSQGAVLQPQAAQEYKIGFSWPELNNTVLTRSGSETYTFNCGDAASAKLPDIAFFGQNGGTATWDGTEAVLTLPADAPASSAAAGFRLADISSGSGTPSTAPTFTTNAYNAGSPRMNIYLADLNGNSAGTAWGYPIQVGSADYWSVPGNGGDVHWSGVTSYMQTHSLHIDHVSVIMDGDQTPEATSKITCLNYEGSSANFGTGC